MERAPIFTKNFLHWNWKRSHSNNCPNSTIFIDNSELGKIEWSGKMERALIFFRPSKFPWIEFGSDTARKIVEIRQFLFIYLIRPKCVNSYCKIGWSGKIERALFFHIIKSSLHWIWKGYHSKNCPNAANFINKTNKT